MGDCTPVYIHNAGLSRFGKRDEGVRELIAEAVADAGLSPADLSKVDALIVGNQAGEALTGEGLWSAKVAEWFCPNARIAQWVNCGSASGAAAVQTAFYFLQSPAVKNVLVVAFEKMSHLSTAQVTSEIRKVLAVQDIAEDFTMLKGAAWISRMFSESGRHEPADWSRVAVKNHHNAVLNPKAQFHKEITLDEAAASRIVAQPLRLFHCSPISDGAAVGLLSGSPSNISIRAAGSGLTRVPFKKRRRVFGFEATQKAAQMAFGEAGIGPEEIGFAEVHDAFTPFELIGIEDLGLSPPGRAPAQLLSGRFAADGEVPINASGGLKGRGHPVGASGLAQVVEVAKLFRGDGMLDYSRRRFGLAMSIGGLAAQNFVTILENHSADSSFG